MSNFGGRARGQDRANLYQEITDKIIGELESGRVPWVQPRGKTTAPAPLGVPKNAATRRRYSGINIIILWSAELHQTKLGRTPHLIAADAAFYSRRNEAAAKQRGVKRLCIPNHASKSAARKREQKKRWFRSGQKWRTGCEGRISVIKRRHGLARSRYKGDDGMKRWVGLGVIADNLLSIARASLKKPAS
jgi:N-terminal domain of anti-restriction factor ArdC/Transposase DDE domain